MKPELDERLCTAYPEIFAERHLSMDKTAMCWGFACGDGWFNILDRLCAVIMSDYTLAKDRYAWVQKRLAEGESGPYVNDEVLAQNKLDMEAAVPPVAKQVKEKFGTLRFYTEGASADVGASERQEAYVRLAEALSAVTCEVCGAPGKRGGHGYIRTLCESCREKDNASDTRPDSGY